MARVRHLPLPARAMALAAVLASVGCSSKPVVAPQSFTIDPPAARLGVPPANGRVVSLRRAYVAPAYSGAALVYRTGDHRIESDPYARLGSSPAWMLTTAIVGYLRDAPFVRDVVAPGDAVPAEAEIEPFASELCGDFSDPGDPVAVLTLQFRVVAPAGATPAKEVLLRTYSQRIRVPQRTAADVVAAWNRGLAAIMKEFLADLKAALPAKP